MDKIPMPAAEVSVRRAQARRSALLLGGLVLLIFIGSILFNVGHG